MTPTRTGASDKESPIARPSPPPALKVTTASLFSKCKSQSVIESRKTRYSPATNLRWKKARHQSVLSIRAGQQGRASPVEDLKHGKGTVCADRYTSNPGDHSPKARNTMETKTSSKATSEYCLGIRVSQISTSVAVPETAAQLRGNSRERDGDKHPSTPSLVANMQVAKHRCIEKPRADQSQISMTLSSSSTGLDTTWPSWSSDSYKGGKDKKRYALSQPPVSRRTSASFNGNFKSHVNLSIKGQSTSPTKASLLKKNSLTRNSPKKKHTSSNKKINSFKSLASTLLTHRIENGPVSSLSASPMKTRCKLALSPKIKKKELILVKVIDSWDSLSPHCNSSQNLIPPYDQNAATHSVLKHTDNYEPGRTGSSDMTKVSAATVASVCRQRLIAKRCENSPSSKRKLSFSPSVMENLKGTKPQQVKSSRSLRNNSSVGARKSTNMQLLKMNKTNRSDRSTDSGFQESVSRATLDWFSSLCLTTGDRSNLGRNTDSLLTLDSQFEPPTNFSNGSPQSAMYSIEEQNRSCQDQSLVFSISVNSIVDDHREMSTIHSTDEQSAQTIQQNKSRLQFVGELYKESLRYPKTNKMMGNSDRTCEEISESALQAETIEDNADNPGHAQHDDLSMVADTYCISDTCGLVSDIVDNNSDITDVSADWDIGPSCQESNREALKLTKKERFSRRDALQHKDPKNYTKCNQNKISLSSHIEKKPRNDVLSFESRASPETSLKEESSMQELSFSPSFPAIGFNSNTRRTVEINYDLIAMTDVASRLLSGNTSSFSDRPGSRFSRRSLSEPPPNLSATKSRHGKRTPSNLSVNGDDAGLPDLVMASRDSPSRSRLRLITFIQSLDHCYWSNMASTMNRKLSAYCQGEFPEPKLFFIGCLFIMSMCMFLAFILTYSIID